MRSKSLILLFLLLAAGARSFAGVALLVSEPYGKFGFFNSTGHASIYLSGVCADTHTRLRLCEPGESGVVISRYNKIAGRDWIAVPLLPYLYAVGRPEEVPASANAAVIARLRDRYRREHLRELVPDDPKREIPKGDWIQLIGAAYDRTIYGFALETTPEADAGLVRWLNARKNHRRFNLIYRNCADFARSILNYYYPGALRRSLIADAGISTPKNSAKTLVQYCRRRPGMRLSHFEVPQIAGTRRSTKMHGVVECLVRSKKYVVPLAVLQPWAVASAGAAYLISGRFNPAEHPDVVCEPGSLAACTATTDSEVRSATEAAERRLDSQDAIARGLTLPAILTGGQ